MISNVYGYSSSDANTTSDKWLKPTMMVNLMAINNLSQLLLERAQEGFKYLVQLAHQAPINIKSNRQWER